MSVSLPTETSSMALLQSPMNSLDTRRAMKPDRHIEHIEVGGADQSARRHHRFGRRHGAAWERFDIMAAPFDLGCIDFNGSGQDPLQLLVGDRIRQAALERVAGH